MLLTYTETGPYKQFITLCSQIPLVLTDYRLGLISISMHAVSKKLRYVSVTCSSNSWDSLIILLSNILISLALYALRKLSYKTNLTCTGRRINTTRAQNLLLHVFTLHRCCYQGIFNAFNKVTG
jgi:hypothetical protein